MDGGGRGAVEGSRGRVAVLAFKDHLLACQDVMNAARCWARAGYRAEILAFDTGLFPQPSLAEDRVRVIAPRTIYGRLLALLRPRGAATDAAGAAPTPPPRRTLRRRAVSAAGRLLQALQKAEFAAGHGLRLVLSRRDCVVACDVPSLLAALAARLLRGTPYLYHSRELALSHDVRGWRARLAKAAERRCHRRAAFCVIQDRTRAGLLGRDNGVPPEGFELVPNAPLDLWRGGRADRLAQIVELPAGRPVVLYAGGITAETMLREIVESIDHWPPEPVLVIHGNPDTGYLPQVEAAAARRPGRVIFSSRLVAPEEVDDLYAGAAAGIAWYRPVDDNFRYVGQAAGKIFNYLKVGVPVVVNELPGMRALVEETGCGLVAADPAGIGPALRAVLADPAGFRGRCLASFPRYEFGARYAAVIRRFEEGR